MRTMKRSKMTNISHHVLFRPHFQLSAIVSICTFINKHTLIRFQNCTQWIDWFGFACHEWLANATYTTLSTNTSEYHESVEHCSDSESERERETETDRQTQKKEWAGDCGSSIIWLPHTEPHVWYPWLFALLEEWLDAPFYWHNNSLTLSTFIWVCFCVLTYSSLVVAVIFCVSASASPSIKTIQLDLQMLYTHTQLYSHFSRNFHWNRRKMFENHVYSTFTHKHKHKILVYNNSLPRIYLLNESWNISHSISALLQFQDLK